MTEQTSEFLTRIPIEVRLQVYEYLDTKSRFNVRSCCVSERTLIDSLKTHYESVEFTFFTLAAFIRLRKTKTEFYEITYYINKKGTTVRDRRYENERDDRLVEDVHPVDLALMLFRTLFKNPKSTLRLFSFRATIRRPDQVGIGHLYDVLNKLQATLKSLGHQLKVEKFTMPVREKQEEVLKVLPHLCSDTLKCISLTEGGSSRLGISTKSISLDKIAQLEQWKKAECLRVHDWFLKPDAPNISQLMHFSTVFVEAQILTHDLDRIVENYVQTGNLRKFEVCLKKFEFFVLCHHVNHSAPSLLKCEYPGEFAHKFVNTIQGDCLYVNLEHEFLGIYKLDVTMEEAMSMVSLETWDEYFEDWREENARS